MAAPDAICNYCNADCPFADEDGDGICDYYAQGICAANGLGYVDADGNGVCDNYESGTCGGEMAAQEHIANHKSSAKKKAGPYGYGGCFFPIQSVKERGKKSPGELRKKNAGDCKIRSWRVIYSLAMPRISEGLREK